MSDQAEISKAVDRLLSSPQKPHTVVLRTAHGPCSSKHAVTMPGSDWKAIADFLERQGCRVGPDRTLNDRAATIPVASALAHWTGRKREVVDSLLALLKLGRGLTVEYVS